MYQVILTDVTIGALVIGKKGARRIPVFDRSIQDLVLAIDHLLASIHYSDKEGDPGLIKASNRMTVELIEKLQGIIGEINEYAGFVYNSIRGGFVCGANGQSAYYFSQNLTQPSPAELINSGVIEPSLIELITKAKDKGKELDIIKLFEDPKGVAKKFDVKLSEKAVIELQSFAPKNVKEIKDPIQKEVVSFIHAVAKDGRYVDEVGTRPAAVAKRLKFNLSEEALDKLAAAPVSEPITAVGIIIIVAVVVFVLIPSNAVSHDHRFKDYSKVVKL